MKQSTIFIGQIPIGRLTRAQWASMIFEEARRRKLSKTVPAVYTSANGNIIARCLSDKMLKSFMTTADGVDADGQPLVFFSRLVKRPIPERCATTDHIYDLCERAVETNQSVYFMGATQSTIEKAVARLQSMYPGLHVAGYRNGYVAGEIETVCQQINEAAPDLLVVGMGVPLEQKFIMENRARLVKVGAIKTGGGVFDFVSGNSTRAPKLFQNAGLEWFYRAVRWPRLYLIRYLLTNPMAIYAAIRHLHHTLSDSKS